MAGSSKVTDVADQTPAVIPIVQRATARLRLRPPCEGDFAFMRKLATDPTIIQFLGRDLEPETRTQQRLDNIRRGNADGSAAVWLLQLAQTHEFIGTFGFWQRTPAHNRAEVGYELLPAFWGKGLMVEAGRSVLQFGFEDWQLHRAEANVDPDNVRSLNLLQRLGFAREAQLREHYRHGDRYIDTVILGLLRSQWKQ